jgi:hypothetical protein
LKIDNEMVGYAVETLLAASAATIMAYLWFLDLVANQRTFGALIGSELVIFAMIIYAYRRPSLTGTTISWLLFGCATAALFLLLAMQLGNQ